MNIKCISAGNEKQKINKKKLDKHLAFPCTYGMSLKCIIISLYCVSKFKKKFEDNVMNEWSPLLITVMDNE